MCSQTELNRILSDFTNQAEVAFGSRLKAVILYGSYARGDYDADSDVDLAVIVDLPGGSEMQLRHQLTDIVSNIDKKYGYAALLSPILISYPVYEEWKEAMPFYRNIETEGVRLSA